MRTNSRKIHGPVIIVAIATLVTRRVVPWKAPSPTSLPHAGLERCLTLLTAPDAPVHALLTRITARHATNCCPKGEYYKNAKSYWTNTHHVELTGFAPQAESKFLRNSCP